MASRVVVTCDWCGTELDEDNPVIAKMYLAPIVRGRTRTDHGSYSASMDIGQCCAEHVVKGKKWHKRQTRKEYQDGRRLRTGTAVEARGRGKTGKAK